MSERSSSRPAPAPAHPPAPTVADVLALLEGVIAILKAATAGNTVLGLAPAVEALEARLNAFKAPPAVPETPPETSR